MRISDEEEFHQEILVTLAFNICVSPHVFPTCTFCQNSSHQIDNCPYWLNNIWPTQTKMMDHRPYLVSLPVPSLISNGIYFNTTKCCL
jgi:hypothetical protein